MDLIKETSNCVYIIPSTIETMLRMKPSIRINVDKGYCLDLRNMNGFCFNWDQKVELFLEDFSRRDKHCYIVCSRHQKKTIEIQNVLNRYIVLETDIIKFDTVEIGDDEKNILWSPV